MRAAVLAMATLSASALAQVVPAAAQQPCGDTLVVSAEAYDIAAGGHGGAAHVDWVRCAGGPWGFVAGASTHRLAESRWSVARAGAIARFGAGHVASATLTAGSGDTAGKAFGYRKLADGIHFKLADRLFAKAEHEYFDIAANRGNVLKAGAVAIVHPGVSIDLTAVRSAGGNLPTRALAARGDWVGSGLRAFAGFAYGRLLPQAADIASGERVPDLVSRQAVAGVSGKTAAGEWIAAFDTTRSGAVRRNTLSVGFRFALP